MPPLPFVHDTGEGPALLLLHAFPLDASQWDHQVAAWAGRYRCLRPDMYGCGRTPLPPGRLSLEAYAGELLAALDARGIADFACIGVSMGGYVALALHALAPARLRAVVLASTAAAADTPGRRRERLAIARRVAAEGIDFLVRASPDTALGTRSRREAHIVDPLRGRVRAWSAEAIAAVEHALADRPDRSASLGAVTAPTLVIGGDDDRLTPPASLDLLAAAIPGARRHTLGGCGHLANLEAPHEFSRVVGEFLAGTLPDPAAAPQAPGQAGNYRTSAAATSVGTAEGARQNPS